MSADIRQPVPYSKEPQYFAFGYATGYAQTFHLGAPDAYLKGEGWAKYQTQPNLVVLVTELQPTIFSIVAYPPAGFEVAEAHDIEDKEIFRGWILQYVEQPYGWRILADSQVQGIDEFIRLRRQHKAG